VSRTEIPRRDPREIERATWADPSSLPDSFSGEVKKEEKSIRRQRFIYLAKEDAAL
jgi:hypothetical protein